MTEGEIEQLLHANQRLNLVLGYAMGLVYDNSQFFTKEETVKYKWLCNAVENIIYLDKPLPPMP